MSPSANRTHYYAILAGLCASSASFFGKLSSAEVIQQTWTMRITCIILMIICNGMVWTFFVKALHSKGSLVATVTSAATNYCFSAFLGCLIFGETTSAFWWLGTILVLSGLVLICLGEPPVPENNEKLKNN